jgi:hypothetical protein
MAGTTELEKLVAGLKKTRSPFGRVRLLVGAWQSVRALSPKQRRKLASQIGFRNAETLLDRVGKSGGNISTPLLRRVIRTARDLDRKELRRLKAGLGDPEKRDQALMQALDLAEKHLAESKGGEKEVAEETPPPVPPPPVPVEMRKPAPVPTEAKPEEKTPAEAVSVPEREPVPKGAEPATALPHEVAATTPSPAVEVSAVAPPRPKTPPVQPPPERPAAPSRLQPRSAPAPSPRAESPRQPRPAPALQTPEIGDLLARLEAEPRLIRRLTLLREELRKTENMGRESLERLVDLFPQDWARRRIVSSLFRAGLPKRLEGATALIERLDSLAARRWCARDLLASRDLTPGELRLISDTYLPRGPRQAP